MGEVCCLFLSPLVSPQQSAFVSTFECLWIEEDWQYLFLVETLCLGGWMERDPSFVFFCTLFRTLAPW